MAASRLRPRPFRFASLRGKLFAAFAGVLVLSLVLTAASFWLQIRVYDTQQVQSELQSAAPSVFPLVKRTLVHYWENGGSDPARLKAPLVATARSFGVRILLIDYCNHVAVDTYSGDPPRQVPGMKLPATCSPWLDDLSGPNHDRPRQLAVELGTARGQQVDLSGTGTSFYLGYRAPPYQVYAAQQSTATPLLLSTIILARAPGSVDQTALGQILPRLAVAGVVAVALTLLVVLLIVRAITRPLRTITAASERMAGGDYDQSVPAAGEDEVGQLARSFNRMATEVRDARELQRQFIANVSHDLKTPLTSILGFGQILAESDGVAADPMQQRAVQVINEEARRLQRLTTDLLDLSRLEAHQLQLRHGLCDLNEIAGAALGRYSHLPANAALHFLDQRASGILPVWGDPDRLMQVLVNLLDNAVKFCDPAGSVALATLQQGDTEIVLSVANTGAGIAPEDLTRVFQRFYRTDHSRATRTGGTGLGLAIVREIVAAHGGRVDARSNSDGWTRFSIWLPTATGAVRHAGG